MLLVVVGLACALVPLASGFQFVGVVSPARLGEAVGREAAGLERHAQCRADWQHWLAALNSQEHWAVRMADSWTKTVSGLFEGNYYDLGNFDECLRTDPVPGNSLSASNPVIRTAYILPAVSLTQASQKGGGGNSSTAHLLRAVVPVTLRVAACVPDSCEAELLRAALQAVAQDLLREEALTGDFQVAVSLPVGKQSKANTRSPGLADWAFLVVITVLLLVALVATIVSKTLHPSQHKDARQRWRLLLVFSCTSSWRRLTAPAPPGSIRCIDGIRVLSTLHIIFGHANDFFSPVMNARHKQEASVSLPFMALSRYYHGVDTFLAIAGMLCCMSFLRAVEKKGGFNFFEYIVHRYARITPVLAIATGFGATWYDLMRNGVDASAVGSAPAINWFKDYWWASLLYISNYMTDFYHIFQHTWYLSVDMQLYILAPLILIPLWRRPTAGIVLIVLLTLGFCAVPGYLATLYRARSTFGAGITDPFKRIAAIIALYPSTHTRFPSYLAGIGTGYFLYQVKREGLKLNLTRFHATVMWLLSSGIALAVLFGPYAVEFELDSHPYNAIEVFFYIGFEKLAWAVSVLLVIIACETGCGGAVNHILSWRIFCPLGRLCLNMYLVHFFIQRIDELFLVHSLEYFSTYALVRQGLLLVALSLPFSALLFIVVEQPFILFESELWILGKSQAQISSNNGNHRQSSVSGSPKAKQEGVGSASV